MGSIYQPITIILQHVVKYRVNIMLGSHDLRFATENQVSLSWLKRYKK